MIVDLQQKKRELTKYILLAQDANDFIQQNHPYCITHSLTGREIEKVAEYMTEKRYGKILYMYGYKYLLGILDFFTITEQYEYCGMIVTAINTHNEMVNDKIPTSISQVKEAVMA